MLESGIAQGHARAGEMGETRRLGGRRGSGMRGVQVPPPVGALAVPPWF